MSAPVSRLQFLAGIELGRLATLLLRHRVPLAQWRAVGQLAFLGLASSVLSLADALRLRGRLARVELVAPPVFIIGHWRSGTTFAQRLLACDAALHTPTFFECTLPRGFLSGRGAFARGFAAKLPATRAFDEVPLGLEEPFEEEFALLKLALCSPMLEDVFPADAARYATDDGFGVDADAAARWRAALDDFARRLTLAHGKRLLLKSPANTFRVPLLRELFPGAKFIHMHRHPCEVAASTLGLRAHLREHNALQSARPGPSPAEVVARLARAYAAADAARAGCAPHEFCDLGLDALQADPLGALAGVYRQLALPGFEAARPAMAGMLARVGSRRQVRQLAPELADRIRDECAAAFRRYGYQSA